MKSKYTPAFAKMAKWYCIVILMKAMVGNLGNSESTMNYITFIQLVLPLRK